MLNYSNSTTIVELIMKIKIIYLSKTQNVLTQISSIIDSERWVSVKSWSELDTTWQRSGYACHKIDSWWDFLCTTKKILNVLNARSSKMWLITKFCTVVIRWINDAFKVHGVVHVLIFLMSKSQWQIKFFLRLKTC